MTDIDPPGQHAEPDRRDRDHRDGRRDRPEQQILQPRYRRDEHAGAGRGISERGRGVG